MSEWKHRLFGEDAHGKMCKVRCLSSDGSRIEEFTARCVRDGWGTKYVTHEDEFSITELKGVERVRLLRKDELRLVP